MEETISLPANVLLSKRAVSPRRVVKRHKVSNGWLLSLLRSKETVKLSSPF
jgi:hypothetical protein